MGEGGVKRERKRERERENSTYSVDGTIVESIIILFVTFITCFSMYRKDYHY